VTPAARRLCALAALFAPERARGLVGRLARGGQEAAREADRLVASARRERLLALAEVLAFGAEAPGPEPGERPRVAEVLRAVRTGAPTGAAQLLLRICREQAERGAAGDHPATCRRP
jgi:hypothetical protein